MRNLIFIPYCKISPESISYYSICENKNYGRMIKSQLKDFNIISRETAVAMREKIKWFLFCSKTRKFWCVDEKKWIWMKAAMITLTLASPQNLTDTEVKKRCLNHFLTVMREKYKIRNYIWRAESQQNGRIHFHILINKFWDWRIIRKLWNHILDINGLLSWYQQNYNNDNPNSVDIHSLKRIRNIVAYVTKYLTSDKDTLCNASSEPETNVYLNGIWDIASKRRVIEGKKYGCCVFLYSIKNYVNIITNRFNDFINIINQKFSNRIKKFDYSTLVEVTPFEWKNFAPEIAFEFFSYVKTIWDASIPRLNFS
jgi:hypothetical protein